MRVNLEGDRPRHATSHDIHAFLGSILASPKQLRAIASRSYLHPTGFYKIPLLPGRGLRLHVWNDLSVPQSHIHNHAAPFKSTILVGSLIDRRYALDPSGTTMYHSRFPSGKGDGGRAVRCGLARLHARTEIRHRAGKTYEIKADELHSVTPLLRHGLAATLVSFQPIERTWTDVFTAFPPDLEYSSRPSVFLSPEELRELLYRVYTSI